MWRTPFARDSVFPLTNDSGNLHQIADKGMNAHTVQDHILPIDVTARLPNPQVNHSLEIWLTNGRIPVSLAEMSPWLDHYLHHRVADLLHRGFSEGFLAPHFMSEGC